MVCYDKVTAISASSRAVSVEQNLEDTAIMAKGIYIAVAGKI